MQKFTAILIGLLLILPTSIASAQNVLPPDLSWAEEAVTQYIQPDQYYRLHESMNRCEFAMILSRSIGAENFTPDVNLPFTDVPDWAVQPVKVIYNLGVMLGKNPTAGYFGCAETISRAEVAVALERLFNWSNLYIQTELSATQSAEFVNTRWGEMAFKLAMTAGVIRGYPDGSLRPEKSTSRAEGAVMVNRGHTELTRAVDLSSYKYPITYPTSTPKVYPNIDYSSGGGGGGSSSGGGGGGVDDGGDDTDDEEPPVEDDTNCAAADDDTCYYISTSGNDANDGSLDNPFRTFGAAVTRAEAGDYIYVRGGTYSEEHAMTIGRNRFFAGDKKAMIGILDMDGFETATAAYTVNSGTSSKPITIRNYPGETPVLDMRSAYDNDADWAADSESIVYVYNKSNWVIQGFEMRGGMVNIVGSTASNITVQDNNIHSIIIDGGDNPGIVRIDRGYGSGGPNNIQILNNELHDIYDIDFPSNWQNTTDIEHFGALTVLSREHYEGYAGGGTQNITFSGNEVYNLPQAFYFKNPMRGPVEMTNNTIYNSNALGVLNASNLHMHHNLVYGIENGFWRVSGTLETDPQIIAIDGQSAQIEYNTFVGLNTLLEIGYSTNHNVHHNIFFGLSGQYTGANWDEPAYIEKSEYYDDPYPETSGSLLGEMTSDRNCFITPTSDILFAQRRFLPSATGAGTAITNHTAADARTSFGWDTNSVFRVESSPSAIFVSPGSANYSLQNPALCPGMGKDEI